MGGEIMPIGDYQVEDKEYAIAPKGSYVVYISDMNGDLTAAKPYINVRYTIDEGPSKNTNIFKRYYLTEKTLQKFIPWQFGIMGIWHDVKEAKDFAHGVEIAIDKLGGMISTTAFDADVEVETYEGQSGTKQRNNIVLKQNLGDRTGDFMATDVEKPVDTNSFNSDEELPF